MPAVANQEPADGEEPGVLLVKQTKEFKEKKKVKDADAKKRAKDAKKKSKSNKDEQGGGFPLFGKARKDKKDKKHRKKGSKHTKDRKKSKSKKVDKSGGKKSKSGKKEKKGPAEEVPKKGQPSNYKKGHPNMAQTQKPGTTPTRSQPKPAYSEENPPPVPKHQPKPVYTELNPPPVPKHQPKPSGSAKSDSLKIDQKEKPAEQPHKAPSSKGSPEDAKNKATLSTETAIKPLSEDDPKPVKKVKEVKTAEETKETKDATKEIPKEGIVLSTKELWASETNLIPKAAVDPEINTATDMSTTDLTKATTVTTVKPEGLKKEKKKSVKEKPIDRTPDNKSPQKSPPKKSPPKKSPPKMSLPKRSPPKVEPPKLRSDPRQKKSDRGKGLSVNIDEILRVGSVMERHGMSQEKKNAFEWIALNRQDIDKSQKIQMFSAQLNIAVGDVEVDRPLIMQSLSELHKQSMILQEEYYRLCKSLAEIPDPITIGQIAFMLRSGTKFYKQAA